MGRKKRDRDEQVFIPIIMSGQLPCCPESSYPLSYPIYYPQYPVYPTPNPDTPNTVAIASLLYPPKLSWFSRDGPKPFGYHNQIEKIDWLNHKIHDLNLKNNRPIYLGLHSYGTRKLTRSYTDSLGQEQSEHIRCHRWEHWEEPTRRNKFHLRNDRRFKVGLALNNYFVTRT